MGLFFKDDLLEVNYSWDKLCFDIEERKHFNPYCFENNFYEIFLQIILAGILQEELTILDTDFSKDELIRYTGFESFESCNKKLPKKRDFGFDKSSLISEFKKNKDKSFVTLFTSGTTGKPKKITHPITNLTRFVKIDKKNKDAIWGFAYNPTHIAGIQVFLQAFLNGNTIIRLFGLSPSKINMIIKDNDITHISATPTFYKQLISENLPFPNVKRVTSGGEKLDQNTLKHLERTFPNSKITNVFATTETGSLFASKGNYFELHPSFKNLVKIEQDELLIHNSLLGRSDLGPIEWHNTGDIVKIISKSPLTIDFVSRKGDIINVGGYNVNPHEVEEELMKHKNIKEAHIYAKQNKLLGSVIFCDLVVNNSSIQEIDIRKYLRERLQEYKIPRIINFVESISTTRTGKIKRSNS